MQRMIETEPYVLSICKKEFETDEEFEKRFNDATLLLIKSDYIIVVEEEATDCYIIKYAPKDDEWGCVYPRWLSYDEYEKFLSE